jgi:hypothetical protein
LDISYYDHDTWRKYRLNQYNVVENLATNDEIALFKADQVKKKSFLDRIKCRLYPSGIEYLSKTHIREKSLENFDPKILKLKDNFYLEGYWQNQLYFESIRNILLKEFILKESLNSKANALIDRTKSCNSVSMHIRRSDYLNNEFFFSLSQDYYERAFYIASEKIKDPVFYVFSDDINWAKTNLNLTGNIFFVDLDGEGKDIIDFEVMRTCHHNIIANSTYSWWGAWLNENPDKIVIAPRKWSNNLRFQNNQDKNGFIPSEWMRL